MRYKYIVYALFFASGISGLMYEVVWLRMLARITGVTIYATATVLAAFMAGLALGSFLLGRFIDKRDDPLGVYAVLEFLIAFTALLVPFLFSASVPLYRYVYEVSGESLLLTAGVRAAISFLCVLIPTTVMGGTLPVLTSCLVRKDNLFGRNFSLLYGLNTLGAVFGVLLSGFVTIGVVGEWNTIRIAVAINVLVACIAYTVYRLEGRLPVPSEQAGAVPEASTSAISPYSDRVRRVVLVAFAIGGFTSLAYEVVWTRQLILFLKTSIYAFSGMLAIFLTGIALGSMSMNRLVDRLKSPLAFFGLLELLVGLLSVLNLYLFFPLEGDTARWFFGWIRPGFAAFVIVFPLTFVLGMIFPVAGLCYAKSIDTTGSSVGWLYGSNTVGSILGSLFAGFILIPSWGSSHTVIALAILNVLLGAVLLALESGKATRHRLIFVPAVLAFAFMTVGALGRDPFMATILKKIEMFQRGYAQSRGESPDKVEVFMHKEGIEGTVTVFSANGMKQLWINGIGMTHLCTETKLMAHLPVIFAEDPKEFLVICFGMGTTLKSAAVYPQLNVTAVELVSECYDSFPYFHPDAKDLPHRKNTHLMVNDGRNYLLFTDKKFDVITVDPAPPIWSAGTVNLYSKEFFELCKSHLNPGGAMCLWFPGGSGEENLSIARTFSEVFPYTTVFKGPHNWGFYFIGTFREISREEFRQKVEKAFTNPALVEDLSEYDKLCATAEQIIGLKLASQRVRETTQSGALITDDYPFTEFFLWRDLAQGRVRTTGD